MEPSMLKYISLLLLFCFLVVPQSHAQSPAEEPKADRPIRQLNTYGIWGQPNKVTETSYSNFGLLNKEDASPEEAKKKAENTRKIIYVFEGFLLKEQSTYLNGELALKSVYQNEKGRHISKKSISYLRGKEWNTSNYEYRYTKISNSRVTGEPHWEIDYFSIKKDGTRELRERYTEDYYSNLLKMEYIPYNETTIYEYDKDGNLISKTFTEPGIKETYTYEYKEGNIYKAIERKEDEEYGIQDGYTIYTYTNNAQKDIASKTEYFKNYKGDSVERPTLYEYKYERWNKVQEQIFIFGRYATIIERTFEY